MEMISVYDGTKARLEQLQKKQQEYEQIELGFVVNKFPEDFVEFLINLYEEKQHIRELRREIEFVESLTALYEEYAGNRDVKKP